MATLNVIVEDANNLNVQVTPTPRQTIQINRGVPGPSSIGGYPIDITNPVNNEVLTFVNNEWINQANNNGDVFGPASSTDNALVRFDSTTGKIIQNGLITEDDTGNLNGVNGISTPDFVQFDTTAIPPIALGKLRWNVDNGTLAFGIIDGTYEVNIGEQMYARVTNAEAVTITKGQAVYLYQATGNRATVKLASNTSDATSAKTLGLVVSDIGANQVGFVCTQGTLEKLNTSAYAEGATIYLGSTPGSWTTTKPKAPNHLVYLGVIERTNNGNGQIYVRPQNGYELDEIHDVQINSPVNGQTIIYDQTTSLWKNANLTASTGISVTNGASSITIANTAPDQIVALSAGTGISVSGTYPNFTITNTAAGGGGTVTSVAMSVPTGLVVSGSPVTTSGTIAVTYDTGYSIPTTASQSNWDTAYTDRLKWDGGSSGLVAATGRTSLGATTLGANIFTITDPSAITFPRFNADNSVSALNAADFRTAIGAGTGDGTVTSVSGTAPVASSGGATPAISLASGYGDTQNPYASKTANYFLAAPDGSAGVPTFRSISANDIPTLNQNTTGTASNVTGVVAIANGGTGQTSQTAAFDALSPTTTKGDLIVYDGTDNIRLGVGADTYVLTADSTAASGMKWAAGGSGGVSLAEARKVTSLRI